MISSIVGILSFDLVLGLLLLLYMHVFCRRNYIYPRMMVKGIPFYSIHFQSVLLLHFIIRHRRFTSFASFWFYFYFVLSYGLCVCVCVN